MPGNKKMFKRAMEKWEALGQEGKLSLPPEIGRTAVISTLFTDEPPDTNTGITELAAFRSEAQELARRIAANGGEAELAIDAGRSEITRIIQDPGVASIYMIGNGSLSTLMLDERDYYDWVDVSEATTHLKQGPFVQRQCGGLTRVVNVPMGLFGVSDLRNVHAAIDPAFYPSSLDDPINELIKPIFTDEVVTYEIIKQLGSVLLPETLKCPVL